MHAHDKNRVGRIIKNSRVRPVASPPLHVRVSPSPVVDHVARALAAWLQVLVLDAFCSPSRVVSPSTRSPYAFRPVCYLCSVRYFDLLAYAWWSPLHRFALLRFGFVRVLVSLSTSTRRYLSAVRIASAESPSCSLASCWGTH